MGLPILPTRGSYLPFYVYITRSQNEWGLTNCAIADIIYTYVRNRSFDNKEGQGGYSHFVRRDVDTGASQDLFCIHFRPYQFPMVCTIGNPSTKSPQGERTFQRKDNNVDIIGYFTLVLSMQIHKGRHIPTRYLHREPESDRLEMYLNFIATPQNLPLVLFCVADATQLSSKNIFKGKGDMFNFS